MTPFVAARWISGWASFRASAATVTSPAAIASSTLRMKPRTRERRALLTAVRLAIVRVAFFAEVVLAMYASLRIQTKLHHRRAGHLRPYLQQFGSNRGSHDQASPTVAGHIT